MVAYVGVVSPESHSEAIENEFKRMLWLLFVAGLANFSESVLSILFFLDACSFI